MVNKGARSVAAHRGPGHHPQEQQNETPVREDQGPGSFTVLYAGGGPQARNGLVFSGPNFI